MEIKIVNSKNENCSCLICPHCGVHELVDCTEKDVSKWRFNIKAFRIDDQSKCLKCDNWFKI